MRRNFIDLYKIIKKDSIFLKLIIIFFTICLIISVGSLGSYFGGRYAAIPGIVMLLMILHLSFIVSRKLKFLLMTILFFALFNGINEFRPHDKSSEFGLKMLDCIKCPNWKNEIIKWQNDKTYTIKIWPYPRKTMRLEI